MLYVVKKAHSVFSQGVPFRMLNYSLIKSLSARSNSMLGE